MMALSGVDLALWDVLGRAQGMPVYAMLGGLQHEKISCYATGQDTQWYAELGYEAHKLPHRWYANRPSEPQYEALYNRICAARALLGDESRLMLGLLHDLGCSGDAADGRRGLASQDIYWFEDVTTPRSARRAGRTAQRD